MTVEAIEARRIVLDSGEVIIEIYDDTEGVYEYYMQFGDTLRYFFGVGEPFTPKALQRLVHNGYFDADFQ